MLRGNFFQRVDGSVVELPAVDEPQHCWFRQPGEPQLVHQFVNLKLRLELEEKGMVFVGIGDADGYPAALPEEDSMFTEPDEDEED